MKHKSNYKGRWCFIIGRVIAMFKLYDKVRIKSNAIAGTIVDISSVNVNTIYIVESDISYTNGGYGDKWKLYDCKADEIEKII